jgi:hypothetical protein
MAKCSITNYIIAFKIYHDCVHLYICTFTIHKLNFPATFISYAQQKLDNLHQNSY